MLFSRHTMLVHVLALVILDLWELHSQSELPAMVVMLGQRLKRRRALAYWRER